MMVLMTSVRRRRLWAASLGALLLLAGAPSHAVQPDEILSDAALEARARHLSAGLRCLVCQNQSIDDSDAPLARDLRLLVRERLTAGDSDEAVRDFIVARYGEFVLLKPPLKWSTLILWLAPIALALGAAAMAARYALSTRGGARSAASSALTADEEAKLKAALDDGQDPGAGAKG
jgi:cytochrome c-type biogenesis protein CcmH